jgi:hypothetical protein
MVLKWFQSAPPYLNLLRLPVSLSAAVRDLIGAEVGRHDDEAVAEGHSAALGVAVQGEIESKV